MEIYWKFKISDGEIINISRMVNGGNMKFSKNLSNRNVKKLHNLVFVAYAGFELLGILWAAGKNDPLPLGLVGINH